MPKLFATLAAASFAVASFSAFAHAIVETASPRNGETLSATPTEIRLRFNEALEPAFTSVTLTGPSGQQVPTAEKARVDGGKTVVQPLPALAAGVYKAQWTSVGHDGHRVHGELNFTVK